MECVISKQDIGNNKYQLNFNYYLYDKIYEGNEYDISTKIEKLKRIDEKRDLILLKIKRMGFKGLHDFSVYMSTIYKKDKLKDKNIVCYKIKDKDNIKIELVEDE